MLLQIHAFKLPIGTGADWHKGLLWIALSKHLTTMRLNMALNGILVGSATLDPSRCKDEFYLQAMRRLLKVRNNEIMEMIPAKPVYYIEVASSMPALSYTHSGNGSIEHSNV